MDSKLSPFLFCRCDYGMIIDFDALMDEAVFRDTKGNLLACIELGKLKRFRLSPTVAISVPKRRGHTGDYVRLLPSELKDSLNPDTLRLLRYCSREYVFDVVDYRSDEVIFIFDHGRKFYVHVQT